MIEEQKLPVILINKQYMNNTKIARVISTKNLQISASKQQYDIEIKDNIISLVDLWSDVNNSMPQTVNQYDMAVMDAVLTLIDNGLELVTPEWILKVMSGNKDQWFSDKKLDDVRACIQKLQGIYIKIDCTEENNAYRIKERKEPEESCIYESSLLPFGNIKAKHEINGKLVTAYTLLEKPALYRYAKMNRQIIDVPACIFETQKQFRDTDKAIIIKRYVIKRVAQIVNANNLSNNRISFYWYDASKKKEKGLYIELGYKINNTTGWRKMKSSINNVVKGTLQTLVDCKAISSFKPYRKDGTNNSASPIAGYIIYYNPQNTIL